MLDYISPLQELLPKLKLAMISGKYTERLQDFVQKKSCEYLRWIFTGRTDYARDLGNKLLVYISCCFAGRGYPTGDIEESMVETVRNQVFQSLCNQHSLNADDDEEIYPYLRYKYYVEEVIIKLYDVFDD